MGKRSNLRRVSPASRTLPAETERSYGEGFVGQLGPGTSL
jgi:hypothetical protein